MIKLIQKDTIFKQTETYYPWYFVYFHGNIEHDVYFQTKEYCADLVAGNLPLDNLIEGVYDAECYGKQVKIFLWYRQLNRKTKILSGLVINPTIQKDLLDAKAKYNRKQNYI